MSVIRPAIIEGDDDLELSVENHLISQPLAEVGIRNSGKSYLAGKICEQLCEAKQPFIIIDVEGEYWTLREKYAVIVASVGKPIGRPKGYKADLLVDGASVKVLANRIAEKGYTVVLDLRNATMNASYEALGNFLESLYESEGKFNRPLVLIMEEAHVLVPEVGRVKLPGIRDAQNKVIYWTYEIAARGRHRGIGYVCIARRSAEVAKAVMSQCTTRIMFRLVDPADLAWLRESGLSKEEIEQVQTLEQGSALAFGIEERPFLIKTKARLCTHGGKTPIAMAVDTPELEKAIGDLSQLLKTPSVKAEIPSDVLEKMEKEKQNLSKKIDDLTNSFQQERKTLKDEIIKLKGANLTLSEDKEKLLTRVKELEETALSQEEKQRLVGKISDLESQVSSLKEQLGQALQYEGTFEKLRELMDEEKEIWLEIASLLGTELIPKDVQDLIKERDESKAKLEVYEREEKFRKELVDETLKDQAVQSWIQDARRFLTELKSRRGGVALIFKTALRMDQETVFLPEELQTGLTGNTNLTYLNDLADKKLLWEATKGGRKAFRNRFKQWITENVRRIKPTAPDEAVNKIHDELKEFILR